MGGKEVGGEGISQGVDAPVVKVAPKQTKRVVSPESRKKMADPPETACEGEEGGEVCRICGFNIGAASGFLTGFVIALLYAAVVPVEKRHQAELAKSWYMQESFNRDDDDLTQLKL